MPERKPTGPTRPDGLTHKQFAFVCKYVECGRAGEAYRHAYQTAAKDATVNTEVARLLKRPAIVEAIRRFRADLAERAEVTVADVIRELWDNARKAKGGEPVLDKDGTPTGEWRADFSASNQALVAVGKHLGAFDPRPDGQHDNPLALLTAEQRAALRRIVEQERERRRAASASAGDSVADGTGAGRTLQ